MAKVYSYNGTLAASPVTVAPHTDAGFIAQEVLINNRHASNNYTFATSGISLTIPANSWVRLPITVKTATINGTGDYTILYSDKAGVLQADRYSTQTIATGSVTGAMLADDTLTAAIMQAKLAANSIDCTDADILAAFAANGFDQAFMSKVLAADSMKGTDVDVLAAFGTDGFDETFLNQVVEDSSIGTPLLRDVLQCDMSLAADLNIVVTCQIVDGTGASVAAATNVSFQIVGELAATYTIDTVTTGTQLGSHAADSQMAITSNGSGVIVFTVSDVAGASGVAVLLQSQVIDIYTTGAVAKLGLGNGIVVTFD